MEATGLSGSFVEIHYNCIGNHDVANLIDANLPNFIKTCNNVIIQFNHKAKGSLCPLTTKHADTSIDFKHLTSILQGVNSNYDTNIFATIFAAIWKIISAQPYLGRLGMDHVGYVNMAYRVVADHVRTLYFVIVDGDVPSNVGMDTIRFRCCTRQCPTPLRQAWVLCLPCPDARVPQWGHLPKAQREGGARHLHHLGQEVILLRHGGQGDCGV